MKPIEKPKHLRQFNPLPPTHSLSFSYPIPWWCFIELYVSEIFASKYKYIFIFHENEEKPQSFIAKMPSTLWSRNMKILFGLIFLFALNHLVNEENFLPSRKKSIHQPFYGIFSTNHQQHNIKFKWNDECFEENWKMDA